MADAAGALVRQHRECPSGSDDKLAPTRDIRVQQLTSKVNIMV